IRNIGKPLPLLVHGFVLKLDSTKEVEIEAKVLGHKGKFSSNKVFIRNKVNVCGAKRNARSYEIRHTV
ncbi:hypothetical protein MKX01_040148, partial [Papaver californicum]